MGTSLKGKNLLPAVMLHKKYVTNKFPISYKRTFYIHSVQLAVRGEAFSDF